jgi:hypothetical protein
VGLEAQLASEGMAPIEGPEIGCRLLPVDELAIVDEWLIWARTVERTHQFHSARAHKVWRLYASGTPFSEIVKRARCHRFQVVREITRIEAAAPPAPTENPWRKSGRSMPVSGVPERVRGVAPGFAARIAEVALRCADMDRVREMLHNEPEILRILPQGDSMSEKPQPTKIPGALHYSTIKLRDTIKVTRPRIGAVMRDSLVDVMGRPHAGGIDVALETRASESDGGADTTTIITVPWWKIMQADRVVEGSD